MMYLSQLHLLCLAVLSSITATSGKFTVYWNVPLTECTRNDVLFDLDQFDIVHNDKNSFYGEKVDIFYEPGKFPVFDAQNNTINGGIPQLGNLSLHIQAFRDKLEKILPEGFSGPAVLDFETYFPSYIISLPTVYRVRSLEWVKYNHPSWSGDQVRKYSQKSFDAYSRRFFEVLLTEGARLRPNAMFGYYHYPYCHNYYPPYTKCKTSVTKFNDQLQSWLYHASTALYPSLYTFYYGVTPTDRWNKLSTRMKETNRVNAIRMVPVLPYFWYRYHDTPRYLEESVVEAVLWIIRIFGGDGIMFWGAHFDLGNKENCTKFKKHMDNTLGPILKCFHDMPDSFVDAVQSIYLNDEDLAKNQNSDNFRESSHEEINGFLTMELEENSNDGKASPSDDKRNSKGNLSHNRELSLKMVHNFCRNQSRKTTEESDPKGIRVAENAFTDSESVPQSKKTTARDEEQLLFIRTFDGHARHLPNDIISAYNIRHLTGMRKLVEQSSTMHLPALSNIEQYLTYKTFFVCMSFYLLCIMVFCRNIVYRLFRRMFRVYDFRQCK